GAQMLQRGGWIETENPITLEQRELPVRARALDREQTKFSGYASIRGEAAQPTVGGQNAMTRDHDCERIAPESLAYRASRTQRAKLFRDLAVRKRGARWNRARDLVHAAIKWGHSLQIERYRGEIALLSAQQRHDSIERQLDFGWRRDFPRLRKTPAKTLPRLGLAPFGKLNTDYTAFGPGDAAATDGCVEQGKRGNRHEARDFNIGSPHATWRILLRRTQRRLESNPESARHVRYQARRYFDPGRQPEHLGRHRAEHCPDPAGCTHHGPHRAAGNRFHLEYAHGRVRAHAQAESVDTDSGHALGSTPHAVAVHHHRVPFHLMGDLRS